MVRHEKIPLRDDRSLTGKMCKCIGDSKGMDGIAEKILENLEWFLRNSSPAKPKKAPYPRYCE
jgi:hypothetical protein